MHRPDSHVNIPPVIQQQSDSAVKDWNFLMVDELESDEELSNVNKPNKRTAMESWQIDNASSVTADSTKKSWTVINIVPPTTTVAPPKNHHVADKSNVSSIEATSSSSPPLLIQTPLITDFISTKSAIPKKRAIEIDKDDDENSNRLKVHVAALKAQRTTLQLNENADQQVQNQPHYMTPHAQPISSLQAQQKHSTPEPRTMFPQPPQVQPDLTFQLPTVQSQEKPQRNTALVSNGRTTKYTNVKQLCNTFNQSLTIDCNLEDIKSTYPHRKEILSESYRIRIQDYLTMNDYDQAGQITTLLKTPPGLEKHGLSFYTRGNPSVLDKHRHQIFQLGVIKLKPLYMDSIVNRLAKEHKIVCKKLFDRPVQIYLSYQDKLCPILFELKSKEQLVDDDLHGEKKITYSEVIDETVVSNGFKVRWRKGKSLTLE